jgi:DNA-binding transcriptional ArsR family regulator
MNTNIKNSVLEDQISSFFQLLSQSIRIQILLVIGEEEACVCHLEAFLGHRQAVISQHLMVLREAGMVTTRRDGRNIYYRLANPKLLSIIQQAAYQIGITPETFKAIHSKPINQCLCPHCNSTISLDYSPQEV